MKVKVKYVYTGIALIAALILGAVLVYPDQNLHVVFCDVGQGDAILITKGTTQILVDGGPNQKVLGCLSNHLPFWDRTIEIVIATHLEKDHIGGLPDVIERYNVRQLISHSLVNDTAIFWAFRDKVLERNIPIFSPKVGDKIQLAGIVIKVLSPQEEMGSSLVWQNETSPQVLGTYTYIVEPNEASIVTLLSYGDFDLLLPGDISSQIEEVISTETEIEVLKIAHHASKYSSSEEFLERIDPDLAVVSVGKNSFGHPAKEVLERLSQQAIKLLRTDIDGEIEVVSDGSEWEVRR
jgi:competence protein ComEC